MVVSMMVYAASAAKDGGDMGFADGMFWFLLGSLLLFFMPLRSLGALYSEIKGNTLELVFLTRMSSWDIAFGKWLAHLAQIGLLVAAILPYLVVRHYLGMGELGRVDGHVPAARPPTPFARLGNALALGWAAVFLVLGLVAMRRRAG